MASKQRFRRVNMMTVNEGSVIKTDEGVIGVVTETLFHGGDPYRCRIFWADDAAMSPSEGLYAMTTHRTIKGVAYRTLVF